MGNRLPRWITGRPIGQQGIDDEVNSEVVDVNSKVASGFIMIFNIANDVGDEVGDGIGDEVGDEVDDEVGNEVDSL